MNSILSSSVNHVPAFLVKLWKIVDDPSTNDLIGWSDVGNSFIIYNQSKFARELLPLYYKHNNMASFVRQLNMYGFHKVISVEQGGLKVEKEAMEFAHPYFLMGQAVLLEHIKRKISTVKIEDRVKPEHYNKQVLIDVRNMKGKQESMDMKLQNMKRENDALWRELATLRQKHAKQQQVVTKLLQFLVSMMSTQSHRIGFKRRLPLMLDDRENGEKGAKLSRNANPTSEEGSPEGPVIHDVTEEEPLAILNDPPNELSTEDSNQNSDCNLVCKLLTTMNEDNDRNADGQAIELSGSNQETTEGEASLEAESILPDFEPSNLANKPVGNITPPTPTAAELLGTYTFPVPEQNLTTPVVSTSSDMVLLNSHSRDGILHEFDEHLDEVNNGLGKLKDVLQGGQYNIDVDTLSALFGSSADMMGLNSDFNFGLDDTDAGIDFGSGSEMVPYSFEEAEPSERFFQDSPQAEYLEDELDSMLTTGKNHEGLLKF